MIWAALGERGVREDDPATWPPLVHIDSLGGGRSPPRARPRSWPLPMTS
jgi:hypothetical protein